MSTSSASQQALTQTATSRGIPSRYQVVERDDARFLQCSNAANLHLHVVPGLTVDATQRKTYARQSIFLDGVYGGGPFLDNDARQYSFDHHAECVRAFTLATCEQAVIMLLQGLPLAEGNWELYLNEPDLDALLAAWVLLNHAEMLKDGHELLRAAMPLIRVEGVIDAHGLERAVISGLPDDLYKRHQHTLSLLMETEQRLKAAGAWPTTDWLAYARGVLDQLDRLFLTDSYLFQLLEVEEAGSVSLPGGRLAVWCRCHKGIYQAEAALRERYGKQLAIVLLDKGGGHFTVRQVDSLMTSDLTSAYRVLNRRDPRATRKGNNLWGGAAEIGGSPRATGSGLDGDEVLAALERAYRRRGFWRRLFGG